MQVALCSRPESALPDKNARLIRAARRTDCERHRLAVIFEDDHAQAAASFSMISAPAYGDAFGLLDRKLHFREALFQRRQG